MTAGYDRWFDQPLGNAYLASVAVYTQQVPAFEALLAACSGAHSRFHEAVRQLAALPAQRRAAALARLAAGGGADCPGRGFFPWWRITEAGRSLCGSVPRAIRQWPWAAPAPASQARPAGPGEARRRVPELAGRNAPEVCCDLRSLLRCSSRGPHTPPSLSWPPPSAGTAARLGGRTLRLRA
ncbi:MAG: aminopeptidase, partial [Betaproteobacteria bacterium]